MAERNVGICQWPRKATVDRFEFLLRNFAPNELFGHPNLWFEVGPEKEKIGAHKIAFLWNEDCFIKLLENHRVGEPILLPDFEPAAFKLLLEFLYKNKIESDISTLFAALFCSQKLGYQVFEANCVSLLASQLSHQNCIEFYSRSVKLCHQALMETSMEFIRKNVKTVLESAEFAQNSEDDLCQLLLCDDWFLQEIEVFEAVKRWALARADTANEIQQSLRLAMGRTFELIRYPLMTRDQFEDIFDNHPELFNSDEFVNVHKFIRNHSHPLDGFITRKRLASNMNAMTLEAGTSTSLLQIRSENKLETQEDSHSEPEEASPPKRMKFPKIPPPVPAFPVEMDIGPTFQRKFENTEAEAVDNDNDDRGGLINLNSYVKMLTLQNSSDTRRITKIDEELKLSIPTEIVMMPNLEEVRLKLRPTRNYTNGKTFKKYLRRTFSQLESILFFDENPIESVARKCINVSIIVSGVTVLKICHITGTLVMHCLGESSAHAQQLLNTLGNSETFRLRKLVISDCELGSLRNVVAPHLETVVMRRVGGVSAEMKQFFQDCSGLKQLSCNDFSNQDVDLRRDILEKLPNLEKMRLSNFRLCRSGDGIFCHTKMTELYLSNVELENEFVVENVLKMLPALKKVKFETKEAICVETLHKIILHPSIHWIEIRGFKNLKDKSQNLRTFLIQAFPCVSVESLEDARLILKRKPSRDFVEDEEANLLDASRWNGTRVDMENERNREKYFSTDFQHKFYQDIFDGFDTYNWFISTVDDVVKRKLEPRDAKPLLYIKKECDEFSVVCRDVGHRTRSRF